METTVAAEVVGAAVVTEVAAVVAEVVGAAVVVTEAAAEEVVIGAAVVVSAAVTVYFGGGTIEVVVMNVAAV